MIQGLGRQVIKNLEFVRLSEMRTLEEQDSQESDFETNLSRRASRNAKNR